MEIKEKEQIRGIDITDDFSVQFLDSAKKMNGILESSSGVVKATQVSLSALRFQSSILHGGAIEAFRFLLGKYKLPDVSSSDLKKLDSSVLEELIYNFRSFYNVYARTKTRGNWDLKNTRYKAFKSSGVEIAGKKYNYDVTGNMMWGFAGAAGGLSLKLLKQMAGIGQKQMGTSDKSSTREGSYYDDPRDQNSIEAGYVLYQSYKKDGKVDRNNLASVMSKYII